MKPHLIKTNYAALTKTDYEEDVIKGGQFKELMESFENQKENDNYLKRKETS